MSERPREVTQAHGRLLKCTLETDASRAYWAHSSSGDNATAKRAFDEYWFGARSLMRVEELMSNMRVRFEAFPSALDTLRRWPGMSPDARRLICHWHLQLTDPLYRGFTTDYLAQRLEGARAEITQDIVVGWVQQQAGDRWSMATRIQYASKLLSAAFAAGFLTTRRDPRPISLPRVPDDALEYLMYLLREVEIAGSLVDNPYLASVGLKGAALAERLRRLPGMLFRRQGDLLDFGWHYPDLRAWADANFDPVEMRFAGGMR